MSGGRSEWKKLGHQKYSLDEAMVELGPRLLGHHVMTGFPFLFSSASFSMMYGLTMGHMTIG